MIKGTLQKQFPRNSKQIKGTMSCDGKRLLWWDDLTLAEGRVLAELRNPMIISLGAYLVHWRGFEPSGIDNAGREILKYQEWFITP